MITVNIIQSLKTCASRSRTIFSLSCNFCSEFLTRVSSWRCNCPLYFICRKRSNAKSIGKKSSLDIFAELYNLECAAPTFFLRRVWSSWISFFQSCSRCSMSARSLPHAACYINRHSIDFNLWYTITIRYHSSSVSPFSFLFTTHEITSF